MDQPDNVDAGWGSGSATGLRAVIKAASPRPASPMGDLYRNFGDGFSRAFELAVTPLLFGLMGYWLDGRLGVTPLFTLVLALLAVVGLLLRTWYGYVERMKALEQAGPWAPKPETATP